VSPKRKPLRHQRTRTKGSRLPEGVFCVTRPGKFGNPFDSAEKFRTILTQIIDGKSYEVVDCNSVDFMKMLDIAQSLGELRGKDLACWCGLDLDCHADVLLEFANR
jgi:hypothetical protein